MPKAYFYIDIRTGNFGFVNPLKRRRTIFIENVWLGTTCQREAGGARLKGTSRTRIPWRLQFCLMDGSVLLASKVLWITKEWQSVVLNTTV
jgi:hypothetical protein